MREEKQALMLKIHEYEREGKEREDTCKMAREAEEARAHMA